MRSCLSVRLSRMRCFFLLGNLPHQNLVTLAIFPQKLIPGFLELLLHLGDCRGIHRHWFPPLFRTRRILRNDQANIVMPTGK